jgi:hypothetical protein
MYPTKELFLRPGWTVRKFVKNAASPLAKMSFDDACGYPDGIETLKFTEKTDLEGWIESLLLSKPIVGKYVPTSKPPADPDKVWTKEELEKHNGCRGRWRGTSEGLR